MKEMNVHVTVEIPVSAMNREQACEMAKKGLEAMTLFKVVDAKVPTQKRTLAQNRSLHLFFEHLAQELNDSGFDMKKTINVDINWSPYTIKEHLWKPLLKARFGKESTTEMTGGELDKIYDELNRILGERTGVHVPFPTIEKDENM